MLTVSRRSYFLQLADAKTHFLIAVLGSLAILIGLFTSPVATQGQDVFATCYSDDKCATVRGKVRGTLGKNAPIVYFCNHAIIAIAQGKICTGQCSGTCIPGPGNGGKCLAGSWQTYCF